MTTEVQGQMTTEAPGNTKPGAFRGRSFQLTLNQIEKYEGLKKEITKLKTNDYFLSCLEEAPKTGHKHIHIYIHFTSPYKLSQKILNFGSHVEICRGSPKQNIDYIRKDGNILDEIGEEPKQGRIYTVKELEEAEPEDIPAALLNIKKIIDEEKRSNQCFLEMLEEIENDSLKGPKIIYITGASGKGKTYTAYKMALKNFKKEEIGKITINNNFFDIVNKNAKCFVIEEFRSSQLHAADFLQLTDKYGFKANTKGGFVNLRPKQIIICSIIKPHELYKNEEINEQFNRRIEKNLIDLDLDDI